ncbi:MAG: DNRLRE domain-containing protein [Verrucomicrobia bacterium]|nr:DNRLRE domain-containing protein [Verrucomicrobiota bacterium]
MTRVAFVGAMVATVMLGGLAARADIVSTNPIADTDLFEVFPNNNLGRSPGLPVGTTATSGASGRMLLRFDIAAVVPAGATINSVTLQLTDNSGSTSFIPSNFELHRMMLGWIEGTNGSLASPNGSAAAAGDPTWNFRQHNTVAWGAPGGAAGVDFATNISASLLINVGNVTDTWASSPGLVADAQAWLDSPATNFGWLLRSDGEGSLGTARRLNSREATADRPLLTIDFTPVPEPTAGALVAFGGVALLGLRRRGR